MRRSICTSGRRAPSRRKILVHGGGRNTHMGLFERILQRNGIAHKHAKRVNL